MKTNEQIGRQAYEAMLAKFPRWAKMKHGAGIALTESDLGSLAAIVKASIDTPNATLRQSMERAGGNWRRAGRSERARWRFFQAEIAKIIKEG